jgi:hypothetical protein
MVAFAMDLLLLRPEPGFGNCIRVQASRFTLALHHPEAPRIQEQNPRRVYSLLDRFGPGLPILPLAISTAPPRHSLTAVIVYLCVTAVLSCLAAESLSFKAIGAEPLGDVSPQAIVLHGGWFLLEEAICGNNDQRFSTPGFRANGWYRTRVLTTNRPPVSENPANETQSLAHACCWSASAARVGSKSIPNR